MSNSQEPIVCVYKIECLKTGKVYIGQTTNFNRRRQRAADGGGIVSAGGGECGAGGWLIIS